MRIVIDMQGAQTESRFRGIGRYSMSLTKAIIRNRGEHEIILALNGLFPETIEPIRAEFDHLLPQENIRVWYAPGPVRECEPGNDWRREVAEHIREAFLASLNPDMVLICSLFEGYVDDAVTSIGAFIDKIPTSVILYDLIPLLNPALYLANNPTYAEYYHRKIVSFKRAELWLSISKSSAMEGQTVLSLTAEKTINISTACDGIFQPLTISEEEKLLFLDSLLINKPFILYSGSAETRKNLDRLIRAYASMPFELREKHQLVLAGKIVGGDSYHLRQVGRAAGIKRDQLVLTGYITDEQLVNLYNLCSLFVLPSLHEGFGLPALEAMNCGAVVIGSNCTSIPEVIGKKEALFDPTDEKDIRKKMIQALIDDDFRKSLINHALQQAMKFSWDTSAKRVIDVFEGFKLSQTKSSHDMSQKPDRPKLAYVSPLPPERSGIADYSAELLPALAKYYDIDVIIEQEKLSDEWIKSNCQTRTSRWFLDHSDYYDRVLYHVGNSPYHQHMLDLIKQVPGTVMLHDFYLSSLYSYLENTGTVECAWVKALYKSHGYFAIKERFHADNDDKVKMNYPANLQVLQHAQGVIVHSEYSRKLAMQWYGQGLSDSVQIVPMLSSEHETFDRNKSRGSLGIISDNFVVCCFGFLDPTKLNHRLLEAWSQSNLAKDSKTRLVFVGENHCGTYGKQLTETIRRYRLANQVTISGWVDMAEFKHYLASADVAVQLRTNSRGETSAALFNCLNHQLPVIINANGSFAELPQDAVWMLPDEFDNSQLIEALETLWQDKELREKLGRQAKELIISNHKPEKCAQHYYQAIEGFYLNSRQSIPGLIDSIATLENYHPKSNEIKGIAQSLAQTIAVKRPAKQLLLDLTATVTNDLKTGIERVARALTVALVQSPPEGYMVEPVYLSKVNGCWRYCYARKYTLSLLNCPHEMFFDDWVEAHPGDIILGLDISGHKLIEAEAAGLITLYKNHGVKVFFMVYDLLPIIAPQFFPPGAGRNHEAWLKAVSSGDGAICISRTVADELSNWLKNYILMKRSRFKVGWNHLGSDLEKSNLTIELPDKDSQIINILKQKPTFLMVGTIEPRKGYLQTLKAFDILWSEGKNVVLVIVGKEGWLDLPDDMRRTIPEIVSTIRNHPELGKRLYWLEGISDEYLEKTYKASTCLIAASEAEGFGLPLIEAAQRNLPIIAREIPVFREVAGEHALYFNDSKQPKVLVKTIIKWLDLFNSDNHPKSDSMTRLTWQESAEKLMRMITCK